MLMVRSHSYAMQELYVGIAEEFDPRKPLAEVKSEGDL